MPDDQDIIDFFHERAGIYQYDAGNTLDKAEWLAKLDVRSEFNITVLESNKVWAENRLYK